MRLGSEKFSGSEQHSQSYREIKDATGIKYSTVRAILGSEIYLGEILHNGQWSEGRH